MIIFFPKLLVLPSKPKPQLETGNARSSSRLPFCSAKRAVVSGSRAARVRWWRRLTG
jgi:hypothetical protein